MKRIQESLKVEKGEADGLVGLLSFHPGKEKPLIDALSGPHENRALSAALGRAGAVMHSRSISEGLAGNSKLGKNISVILESVIRSATAGVPSREYMIDLTVRLQHALETENSKTLEPILEKFAYELTVVERSIEGTGGNCCAEGSCKCENRRTH